MTFRTRYSNVSTLQGRIFRKYEGKTVAKLKTHKTNGKPARRRGSGRTALEIAEAFVATIKFDKIDGGREYSTEEAAKLINITPRRLRNFCRAGMVGHRVAGVYVIRGGELAKFARKPRPTGKAGHELKERREKAENRRGKLAKK